MDDNRIIDGYAVLHAIRIDGAEQIVAEKNNHYRLYRVERVSGLGLEEYTVVFEDRDYLELQFVNPRGRVEISTYRSPAGPPPGDEHRQRAKQHSRGRRQQADCSMSGKPIEPRNHKDREQRRSQAQRKQGERWVAASSSRSAMSRTASGMWRASQ